MHAVFYTSAPVASKVDDCFVVFACLFECRAEFSIGAVVCYCCVGKFCYADDWNAVYFFYKYSWSYEILEGNVVEIKSVVITLDGKGYFISLDSDKIFGG